MKSSTSLLGVRAEVVAFLTRFAGGFAYENHRSWRGQRWMWEARVLKRSNETEVNYPHPAGETPRSLASALVVVAFDKRAGGCTIVGIVHVFVIDNQIELTSDGLAVAQCGNELCALKSFY